MAFWPVRRVEELAVAIQYGYTAKAKTDVHGPKYLRITDIQDDAVDWSQVPSCEIDKEEIPKYQLQPGDLVFARTGATVGKSYLIRSAPPASVFASYLIRIRFRDEVDPRYVAYFFRSPSYWRQISERQAGIGQPNVNGKKLAQVQLPVAPIEEQRRIVAEIEKQFSRLDEAVANLKRVKANLKRYKNAVLKAAVEGSLVPTEAELACREGRSYETGKQLLQRILDRSREAWRAKHEPPSAPTPIDGFALPEGWAWASVAQVMREPIVNGLSVKESAVPTQVRALRLSAMLGNGLEYEDFRYLPVDATEVADIVVAEGDFFVSRGNGSLALVGRGCRAQKPPYEVIFPDTMMRVRFTDEAQVHLWFEVMWPGRLVRQQIESRVKTTAGIYKISQPQLASMTLPLPPIAEQRRSVQEVERRLSMLKSVETEVAREFERAATMRSSLLARSFGV